MEGKAPEDFSKITEHQFTRPSYDLNRAGLKLLLRDMENLI